MKPGAEIIVIEHVPEYCGDHSREIRVAHRFPANTPLCEVAGLCREHYGTIWVEIPFEKQPPAKKDEN